jgi:hypothetical protein
VIPSYYYRSLQVRDQHAALVERLDTVMKDLGLNQAVRTREQIAEDRAVLDADLANIREYLANISNGIVGVDARVSELVDEIRETVKVHRVKPSVLEASRIDPREITEPDDYNEGEESVIRKGSSVRRMLWRYQNVAEKDFGIVEPAILAEIEKEVAILKQLQQCSYIIQFYGTCQKNGKLHIIMEFAAHGN